MERLQKVIANSGYCSRRKAEDLITSGKVKVNGKIAILGTKVSGNDEIMIDNKIITSCEKEYILLYKPRGVVTTTNDEKQRKTVIDLVKTDKRIYPVGRLDYDTTGVLLLTNDGDLTNILLHPKRMVEKVYIAKIEGIISPLEIKKLENGILIDNKKTAHCKAKIKNIDKKNNVSIVALTIHEGRNHQVKKMFESIGHKVVKLKREKFATLDLKGLKPGQYRKLTIKEVKKLYSIKTAN